MTIAALFKRLLIVVVETISSSPDCVLRSSNPIGVERPGMLLRPRSGRGGELVPAGTRLRSIWLCLSLVLRFGWPFSETWAITSVTRLLDFGVLRCFEATLPGSLRPNTLEITCLARTPSLTVSESVEVPYREFSENAVLNIGSRRWIANTQSVPVLEPTKSTCEEFLGDGNQLHVSLGAFDCLLGVVTTTARSELLGVVTSSSAAGPAPADVPSEALSSRRLLEGVVGPSY